MPKEQNKPNRYPYRPIMVDLGCYQTKCGFAGSSRPSDIIRSVVGYPYETEGMKDFYVGKKALDQGNKVKTFEFMEEKKVVDWDSVEKMFHYIFNALLRVDPKKNPVIIALSNFVENITRQKLGFCEILFDTFDLAGIEFIDQSVLALYSSGKTTGVVIDGGDSSFEITSIFEGYILSQAIRRINFAGKEISEALKQTLNQETISKETLTSIKEKYCAIPTEKYTLENIDFVEQGETYSLGEERFQIPNEIFSPNELNTDISLQEAVSYVIQACDLDIRADLAKNIVLSGGSTMFPGFKERLKKELDKELGSKYKLNITTLADPINGPWIGGSAIGSMMKFSK